MRYLILVMAFICGVFLVTGCEPVASKKDELKEEIHQRVTNKKDDLIAEAKERYGNAKDSVTSEAKERLDAAKETVRDKVHDATADGTGVGATAEDCLLYTSPSPRDQRGPRMPSSA